MTKVIYILYWCDEWKSHVSMKLLIASTSARKIRTEIKHQVKIKDMEIRSRQEGLNRFTLNES